MVPVVGALLAMLLPALGWADDAPVPNKATRRGC